MRGVDVTHCNTCITLKIKVPSDTVHGCVSADQFDGILRSKNFECSEGGIPPGFDAAMMSSSGKPGFW